MKNRFQHLSLLTGLLGCSVTIIANAGPYAYERPAARSAAASSAVVSVHTSSPELIKIAQETSAKAVVNYDTNKSGLSANARATLDNMLEIGSAKTAYGMGSHAVVLNANVVGHTDSRGSETLNQALSQQRAGGVANYMVSSGVNSNKISATGMGETRPIASNRTRDGRAQNRRVEVDVTIARNR